MTSKEQQKGNLYRIVSFERAAEIITGKKLYFAHPSTWDDPYERVLKHSAAKAVFAQCWCRKAVSDAMWRIYSPHGLGVRIATTRKRLSKVLADARHQKNISYAILDVEYLKQDAIRQRLEIIKAEYQEKFSPDLAMEPLSLKRTAFDHEHETRVVLLDEDKLKGEVESGITINIEPFELLTSIWIDPRAPDEVVNAYKYYLKEKLLFPGKVERSGLYAVPSEINV